DAEVLDQRKVPVLLEWSAIQVPAKVPKGRDSRTWVRRRCRNKGVDIQVSIEARVNITRSRTRADGAAGRQLCSQSCRRNSWAKVSAARAGVSHRKRCAGLENGDAAYCPIRQQRPFHPSRSR